MVVMGMLMGPWAAGWETWRVWSDWEFLLHT